MTTQRKLVTVGIVAALGLASYGVIIYPMQHAEEYRKVQESWRADIDRDKIQPGGMRVWSDPFQERKKEVPLYMQKP
ncbi:hypothetical protein FOCC_FOCC009313, partial [Frankliniella occidentalis]